MNGIVLDPSDFTATNGTSVVLATGAATGSLVNIYAFKTFTVADTVSASAGGTFSANVTITGDLTVDTNTLYVDSTNNEVGIGTLTPGGSLEVYKAGTSEVLIGTDNGGTAQLSLYESDDGTKEGLLKYDGTNNRIHLATSGAPNALVIPRDSGNLLHQRTSNTISGTSVNKMTLGDGTGQYGVIVDVGSGSGYYGFARGGTYNSRIRYDYTSNFMALDVNGSERMRIDSSGKVLMGKTSSGQAISGFEYEGANGALLMTRDNARPALLNRGGNDGIIIDLRGQGQTEGTISVSGTTVSYNGGHLSRWSQATDGNRIDGLVKGTVMTNLDQMAVWHHEAQPATYYEEGDELPEGVSVGDEKTPAVDAYDEDNEQLNCMAVSSVEGDANVAGVFVNWDDDDTDFTADMNIAMTGDMVIRIAQGTTVARGDLLMSAGDGTAKPQGDDIVRSKTIAKVTSTTVSHTYDDGSYLVPCVLMAC
jgi:hypothetical protein